MALDRTTELILRHAAAAIAAAATPVPIADVAAVTTVQLDLLRRLAERYDVPFDAVQGRALLGAIAGASLARLGASTLKALPGAGWLAGGAAQMALAGASTVAVGQVFREHFEARGSLEIDDADALRARFDEALERGQDVARTLRQADRREPEDPAAQRLARLERSGVLTPEEVDALRALHAEDDPER
ncbi:MAG: DUF697 domain-containing protein [Myxococcota bacterium]